MEESSLFSDQPGRLPRRDAVALADAILKSERKRRPVTIIFTDDRTMTDLNRRFRKISRPTDVLAFPADPELGILGDIYISIDTARRQAGEYAVSLREEVLRLVCHGVLHLCGYDHHRREERLVMRRKEERHLNRFLSDG
jgi:probable rRNA maturation factor